MEDRILKEFIKNALAEDRGDGDHTSLASIDTEATGSARLIVKESEIGRASCRERVYI